MAHSLTTFMSVYKGNLLCGDFPDHPVCNSPLLLSLSVPLPTLFFFMAFSTICRKCIYLRMIYLPPLTCKLSERRNFGLFCSPLRSSIWLTLKAQSVKRMNEWPLPPPPANPHEGGGCQQPRPLWSLPRFPRSLPCVLSPRGLPHGNTVPSGFSIGKGCGSPPLTYSAPPQRPPVLQTLTSPPPFKHTQ